MVMNADGTSPRTLVDEEKPDGDLPGSPQARVSCRPDGRYVFFVRVRSDGTPLSLWRVPATGGEATDTGIRAPGLRESPRGSKWNANVHGRASPDLGIVGYGQPAIDVEGRPLTESTGGPQAHVAGEQIAQGHDAVREQLS